MINNAQRTAVVLFLDRFQQYKVLFPGFSVPAHRFLFTVAYLNAINETFRHNLNMDGRNNQQNSFPSAQTRIPFSPPPPPSAQGYTNEGYWPGRPLTLEDPRLLRVPHATPATAKFIDPAVLATCDPRELMIDMTRMQTPPPMETVKETTPATPPRRSIREKRPNSKYADGLVTSPKSRSPKKEKPASSSSA